MHCRLQLEKQLRRRRRRRTGCNARHAIDDLLASLPSFATTSARVQRCDLVLEVAHERQGTPDPTFAGGRVVGRVVRSVTLAYTPLTP